MITSCTVFGKSGDFTRFRTTLATAVDAVVHLAGDGVRLSELLLAGGRIASTLGLAPDQLGDRPVTATSIMATPDAARLDRLAADVAAGRLQVPVGRTYRLEEVPQAIADFAAGTIGKLAVMLD